MAKRGNELNGWCVLRMAGPRTLPVVRSLVDAGFDAWSPAEIVTRRKRRSKSIVEFEVPLIPTFAFARARHVFDLIRIANSAVSPHPAFSVMHYQGAIPLIADEELSSLRRVDGRGKPKPPRRVFDAGHRVRLTEGIGAGMTGVVEYTRGEYALVCFPGFHNSMKISTLLLQSDEAESVQPDLGTAARAA